MRASTGSLGPGRRTVVVHDEYDRLDKGGRVVEDSMTGTHGTDAVHIEGGVGAPRHIARHEAGREGRSHSPLEARSRAIRARRLARRRIAASKA
jgi:hypothetical protein